MTQTDKLVTDMTRADFVMRFGGVFEHSPWVAEAAYDAGLDPSANDVSGLQAVMVHAMRQGTSAAQLALVNAHPDLAGKLARAGRLTAESTSEQASAGLDHLTDAERATFEALNDAYKAKFGFPFIMAVKGRSKAEILSAFEARIANSPDVEFQTALSEIEKIATLRLAELMA